MKAGIRKFVALGVMGLGAVVGLWIGIKGPVGAQGNPSTEGLPAPQEFNPEDFQVPAGGDSPAPFPPEGQVPAPTGGSDVPPAFPPDGGTGEALSQDPALSLPPSDGNMNFQTMNPEGFVYNPEGLRDPFFPVRKGKGPEIPIEETVPLTEMDFNPRDPLQAFPLNEYRLVGVLWDVREPRAMVQTPNGKVYSIRKQIRLGREGAVVAAVRESEIVVVQPNPDGSYVNATTRVISMKK